MAGGRRSGKAAQPNSTRPNQLIHTYERPPLPHAGSERWNTNASGWDGAPDLMGEERISEMTAINGSLSALGSVVAALTERRPHVPYRDSRLTHLLQVGVWGGRAGSGLGLRATLTARDTRRQTHDRLGRRRRMRGMASGVSLNGHAWWGVLIPRHI